MPSFDFNNQLVPQGILDIDKIGNCCICGYSEKTGFSYYLLTKSALGVLEIITYGPVVDDIDELPDNYSCSYQKTTFNEPKLKSFINKWLNDRSKEITDASEINKNIFLDNIKDISIIVSEDKQHDRNN